MCLLAFNRYIRIVKTNHYKIFSPRKSEVWLCCVWLSLAFYLLMGGVTNWSTFEFIPGYAGCGVAFTTSKNRIIHYGVVLGLFFLFCRFLSVFLVITRFSWKIRQHKLEVLPSLHWELEKARGKNFGTRDKHKPHLVLGRWWISCLPGIIVDICTFEALFSHYINSTAWLRLYSTIVMRVYLIYSSYFAYSSNWFS